MDTIEERLARYRHELDHAAADTTSSRDHPAGSRRQAPWLGVAAATIAVVGVGGLVALSQSNEQDQSGPLAEAPQATTAPPAPVSEPVQQFGVLPAALPDGYAIWSVSANGDLGLIRPTLPVPIDSNDEITWTVTSEPGTHANPEIVNLDTGSEASYSVVAGQSATITWRLDTQTVELTETGDTVDRDGLIALANAFKTTSPADILLVQAAIASQIRSLFDPAEQAIIDGTTVELFESEGRTVALCIEMDRCETALGLDFTNSAEETVLLFQFEHSDGSSDVFGLLRGSVGGFTPTEGITIASTVDAAGTWVHAYRSSSIESGSVEITEPSAELGELISFSV